MSETAGEARPRIYTVGHLTIDDVVFPDGRTKMGSPGGDAVYSAIGAQLSGARGGIVSRLGAGFPERLREQFAKRDLIGQLVPMSHPPVLEWVLYEHDGSRRYVFHPESGTSEQASPEPEEVQLPDDARLHIAPMPIGVQQRWCAAAASRGLHLTLDPHHDECEAHPAEVMSLLPQVDAFLPSEVEARILVGDDPVAAIKAFLDAGAPIVAIKLGERGAVVSDGGKIWHVPNFPAKAVDVTGAGDSFCGAFAGALSRGADCVTAARWGAAVASFVIEKWGTGLDRSFPELAQVEERVSAISPNQITASDEIEART
ncbi:MAG: carbohydrate kinase family protein [Cryobacterium sp.]|nr:carbohydrate kinase family protein [Cryobacterium sp.]